MQHLATALNTLKRRGREILVLHHVAGLTVEDLARLLEQSVEKVRMRLGRAERHLAQWLGVPDVRPPLTQFAASLDRAWIAEVAACALDYLSTCGPRHYRDHRRATWSRN